MLAKIFNSDKGAILVTGLMFLTVLSLIGTTAYITTSNDLKTSRNYRLSKKAFYDADAGIEVGLAKVEEYLEGTTDLPAVGNTSSLVYTVPSGFNFSLSFITGTTENSWSLSSIGSDPNSGSSSEIEVLFQRVKESVFSIPAFGDGNMTMKSGTGVYSYDPDEDPPCNPSPPDPCGAYSCGSDPNNNCFASTGEGKIGSNGTVTMPADAVVDGINLGDDGGGNEATCSGAGCGSTEDVPRVDPDPMDVNGAASAYNPANHSDSGIFGNDNADITATQDPNGFFNTSTDKVALGNTGNKTLWLCGKTGGADYHFTNVDLGAGTTIIVDTDNSTGKCSSAGPVNLFLDNKAGSRPLQMGTGTDIRVTSLKPADFSVISNSTDTLELKNSTSFYGTIYAPYAALDLKNGMEVYGAVMANTITNFNSGKIFYDVSLRKTDGTGGHFILTDNVSVTSWRKKLN